MMREWTQKTNGVTQKEYKVEKEKTNKKYIKGSIQRKNIQKICEAKEGKVYTHTAFLHSTFLRYPLIAIRY